MVPLTELLLSGWCLISILQWHLDRHLFHYFWFTQRFPQSHGAIGHSTWGQDGARIWVLISLLLKATFLPFQLFLFQGGRCKPRSTKMWTRRSTKSCVCSKSFVTLCNPMDCSPPGSSVQEIPQARILEWAAKPSSKESSRPRDQTNVSNISCIYH